MAKLHKVLRSTLSVALPIDHSERLSRSSIRIASRKARFFRGIRSRREHNLCIPAFIKNPGEPRKVNPSKYQFHQIIHPTLPFQRHFLLQNFVIYWLIKEDKWSRRRRFTLSGIKVKWNRMWLFGSSLPPRAVSKHQTNGMRGKNVKWIEKINGSRRSISRDEEINKKIDEIQLKLRRQSRAVESLPIDSRRGFGRRRGMWDVLTALPTLFKHWTM